MAAYQAGNEAAFAELFERYAGRVYGFLVRRLADRALAEDLYQEAFLRVHRARSSYDSSRPFRTWLFGIVHNLLADTVRARRRSPEVHDASDTPAGEGARPNAIAVASDERSPERLAAARQTSAALDRALRALPSDEATVLILARFEGLSYQDIGVILGRSAAATKQLAYRALKRVRTELVLCGHEGPS
jgi:RNA polymerase sigma-70 factor, ECF subfamily